jgi:hypothetical protein
LITVTISQPVNTVVGVNQSFVVAGQASDVGFPEPRIIDSVTIQVQGGSADAVVLTPVRDPSGKRAIKAFRATAVVTGGPDPHVITVTAVDELGASAKATVSVFTGGAAFPVAAPALLIELRPAPIDPTDPANKGMVDFIVGQIQNQLTTVAALLTSTGTTLAGPNLFVTTNPSGTRVLRIGLWIVGPGFPVVAAQPPNFPLPVLADPVAAAGFRTVPLLPLPIPSGLQLLAFGISIPTVTLQRLVQALLPTLKGLAARRGVSLDSVTVTSSSPASVTTSFGGTAGFPPASIGGTITEVLGTVPVAGASPPQSVPAIISSSFTSSADVFTQVLLGAFFPAFLAEALIVTIAVSEGVRGVAGQATAIATSVVGSIPSRVPFKNPHFVLFPDFPMVVPNWTVFGATASGLSGMGVVTVQGRDQTMVRLTLTGPTIIHMFQLDLAEGVDKIYTLNWSNLVPDPDKFTWTLSGTAADGGVIGVAPLSQTGRFIVSFPLPQKTPLGTYPFKLTVNAVETSGLHPAKTLSATTSADIRIDVLQNPKVLP